MNTLLRSVLALAIIAAINPYSTYGGKIVRKPMAATNDIAPARTGAPISAMKGNPGGDQFDHIASVLTVPAPYATITAALAAAGVGDTIDVAAGVYAENVIVNKSVLIRGAGAGSTTIRPSFTDPNFPTAGTFPVGHSTMFLVQANNVTIEKMTIDGDNPLLPGGTNIGGANIDARNGVVTDHTLGTFNNLGVRYLTVKNIFWRALYASSGGTFNFHDNVVQNVQGSTSGSIAVFNFGGAGTVQRDTVSNCLGAIVANNSKGMNILDNVVTNSSDGVHSDNGGSAGGVADTIQGNKVSNSPASGYGIWVFVPYIAPLVANNVVTNVDYGLGAFAGSFGPTVTARYVNNVIDAQNRAGSIGFYITNTTFTFGLSNVSVNMTQNEFKNNDYGMFIESGTGFTVTMSANGNSIHDNAVIGVDSGAVPVVYGGSGSLGTLAVSLVGNWWGSITGPNHPTTNPSGTGNGIDDGLDYSPWWGADYRSVAHPWTWYVNNSNGSSIQEGVDSASTADIVRVKPGTYNQSPNINKSLTLESTDGRDVTTIMLQTGPTYLGSLTISGADVTVDGFTITGFDAVGLGLASSNVFLGTGLSSVVLSNNRIKVGAVGPGSNGDDGMGVITTYSGSVIVDSLAVSDNLFLPVGAEATRAFYINPGVDHFTFNGNSITGKFNGRAITQAKNGLVEQNTVVGVGPSGSRSAGVGTWGYPDPTVWGHTIFKSNTISGTNRAIAIYETESVVVQNNFLSGNGNGVWIGTSFPLAFDVSTISVSGNSITSSDAEGVFKDVSVSGIANASANWWGTNTAAGVASSVNANVDFTPWLNSATDIGGDPSDGFQGDFSYLNVDDNSPQTGAVARVQEGVNLVSGSTVNLLPGIYEEQVEIDTNLTLIGAGASSTIIKAPITLTKFFVTPGPNNNYPVVYVHDAASVTINGITIDGAGRGNGNYRFIGVGYRNAGGLLTNCTIRDVRETPISGTQHGVAIYGFANNGIPRTFSMSLDSIYGFQKNGTVFTGADLTANINTSTFVGAGAVSFIAQNGIQFSGGSTGSITNNTVRSLSYVPSTTVSTGILLFQPAGVAVRSNTIVETQVGAYFIDVGGDFVGNNVSATLAGVGTSVFWGVIIDPGATVPRAKASPVDAAVQSRRAGLSRGLAILNTRVDSNTVMGDGSNGIGVEADAYAPETLILTANENIISGWGVGAVTFTDAPAATLTSTWRRNKINGNLYGMLDLTGTLQDARENWWGDASGPADIKSLPNTPNYNNLTGLGDSVSANVDYLPWYVDSLLTTLSAPMYSASPGNISFGSVLPGNSKVDSTLVTNVGAYAMIVNSVVSDNTTQFGVAASGPDTLNPSNGKWYHITFHPTTSGLKSGNIIFSHSAATSPDTVTVNGAGGKLFLSIPPDTMIGLNARGRFERAARRTHGYPNWINLLSEVVVQGGFQPGSIESDSAGGMMVALSFMQKLSPGRWKPLADSANIHGWVRLTKWNVARNKGLNFTYLQTTLYDHSGKHTGPAHGFDVIITGQVARPFRKERVSLRPRESSNKLYAEVVAAKFNIVASMLGKTPTGFGDLLLDINGNPYDEMSIIDIVAKADTALTYWQGRPLVEYDSLYSTLYRVNRAFVGSLDTISFVVGNNLVLKGQVEVADRPFLKFGPAPPQILPRTTNETEDEGEFEDDSFEEGTPVATKLYQNYPNPFNPTTTISFRLRDASIVTLKIYNVLGQEAQVLLNNEEMEEGYQTVELNANNFASGVYFYRISAQSLDDASLTTSEVRKMVLIR